MSACCLDLPHSFFFVTLLLLTGFDDPFQRGLVALRQDHIQEAIDAFTAAASAHPNDARVHNFLGLAFMAADRTKDAAAEYLRATELNGQFEDAYRNLGYLEWSSHEHARARSHLERALQLAPGDKFALYYLGRVEMDDHDAASAVRSFERLGDSFDLALAYLYAGRYQDSVKTAKNLPDSADASTVLGVAEAKLGDESGAAAALRKAAEADGGHEERWLNLSRELMGSSHYPEALAAVEQGLRSNPRSYALQLRLGAVHLASGDYAAAEKAFRELVDASDPLPTSAAGLAQVLLRTGRAEEAVTLLSSTERRLGPQFLIVYFEGLALDRSGDRKSALVAFRRAVDMNPENPEAHFGVGRIELVLGQPREAAGELETVLRLQPRNVAAQRLLRLAKARAKEDSNKDVTLPSDIEADREPPSFVGDFLLPDWHPPRSESR
ncbi:MAG: tetratricopeptide repeat protein [Acidobacteriaceae bacterium]|nr:tetratricopeptide repeat protein [Acidobacteriaceae bacterium]